MTKITIIGDTHGHLDKLLEELPDDADFVLQVGDPDNLILIASQEAMIEHGFATRHYQRIEAGLQINMVTALKLAEAFEVKLSELVKGLD